MITGDPGIGKTSSVRLIAKLKGYKTYETNASDQRNKLAINKNAGFMFDNKTLFGGELQDKNLIIMDENYNFYSIRLEVILFINLHLFIFKSPIQIYISFFFIFMPLINSSCVSDNFVIKFVLKE